MILWSSILGALVGFCWAFALHFKYSSGATYGFVIGLIIGLFFIVLGKSIHQRGNLHKGEIRVASSSFIFSIAFIGVALALVARLIRLIVY